MPPRSRVSDDGPVIAALETAAGGDAVTTDPAVLRRFGSDLHHDGPPLLAVVRPPTIDTLRAVVRTTTAT